MRRTLALVAAGVAVAASLGAIPQQALGKKKKPNAVVTDVFAPPGLQGLQGNGFSVPVPFTLLDRKARLSEVEVQYGVDLNADGVITDEEFRSCGEDQLDSRDTRENREPKLFRAGKTPGAAHTFVWSSRRDLPKEKLLFTEFLLTPQGRKILDPENPGHFLLRVGGDGTTLLPAVQIRMRARKGRVKGPWTVGPDFELDNSNPPSMTIGTIIESPPSLVAVQWFAVDDDSEDFNGNGQLDLANGEDEDTDGVLDDERVGVAFDFHRLAEGEDPAQLTDGELAGLDWSPCTPILGVGDNDSLDARAGVPVPRTGPLSGVGSTPTRSFVRQNLFAWDAGAAAAGVPGTFILRARPFDEHRTVGEFTFSRTVIHAQ